MTVSITVTPNPAEVSSIVTVRGTGLAFTSTRVLLDGTGSTTNVFKPSKAGSFEIGRQVRSTVGYQTLVVQQQVKGVWTQIGLAVVVAVQKTVSTTPVITPVVSSPIVVTTNDVTIDGKAFSAAIGSWAAIHAYGTAASPIRRLTIRHCSFKAFNVAILAEHVSTLVIEDCIAEDAAYAGILVFACVGGNISRNTIRRVGINAPPNDGIDVNAYGIAFRSGALTSDFLVDQNVIEDIPSWQGINLHRGLRINVSNNIVRRCRRAYWVYPDDPVNGRPAEITLTGNRAESPFPVYPTSTGVTTSPQAFFVGETDDCAVTGNFISNDFGSLPDGGECLNYVRDYGNASTSLVRSGNVRG